MIERSDSVSENRGDSVSEPGESVVGSSSQQNNFIASPSVSEAAKSVSEVEMEISITRAIV